MTYHRPRTLDEARALMAETPGASFLAGGTDLLVRMDHGLEHPEALISLRSIPELSGITANGTTTIGAMTTLSDVAENAPLTARYGVLAEAVREIGSVQIRNAATLGGNLCGAAPCADSAPALLVLDARIRVLGGGGEREMPLAELFAGPRESSLKEDEILLAVVLDPPAAGYRARFLKQKRVQVDLALASVAVYLEMDENARSCRGARIAAGSVAPTPLRLHAAEDVLAGQVLTPDVLARAAELARDAVEPISDVRAGADYRRHLTGVLLRRAIGSLLPEETP
jgi:carbon-monoxide dehydrogenase medium subunit